MKEIVQLKRSHASIQFEQKEQRGKLDEIIRLLRSDKETEASSPKFDQLVEEGEFNTLVIRLKEKCNQVKFVNKLLYRFPL